MTRTSFRSLILSALFTLGMTVSSAFASDAEVLLVVDSSQSMTELTEEGDRRIDSAKRSLRNVRGLLSKYQVGVICFGHRVNANAENCCQDIETAMPIGAFSSASYESMVNSLVPTGKTPLADSLKRAKDMLVARGKDVPKSVIVLTDGIETCGGDPIAVANEMRRLGINLKIHVIGFAVDDKAREQLKRIADPDSYYHAANGTELAKAIPIVVEKAAPTPATDFRDTFDGEEPASHWEISNEDEDAYIVENGKLLLVTSQGSIGKAKNTFVLNKTMPNGDWTATAKIHADYVTDWEAFELAQYQDDKNYIVATISSRSGINTDFLDLKGMKCQRGKKTAFDVTLGEDYRTLCKQGPMLLRLQRVGRNFVISANLGGKQSQNGWVTLPKLSSLRAKGKLMLSAHRTSSRDGESQVFVDEVTVKADSE